MKPHVKMKLLLEEGEGLESTYNDEDAFILLLQNL